MNNVCKSVEEVLSVCYQDIQCRIQRNDAIYGTANWSQILFTEEGFGVRPKLSGNIVEESDVFEVSTIKHGTHEGRRYRIMENLTPEAFSAATLDDLYLFVTMASPKILRNETIKKIACQRLLEIYEEELSNSAGSTEHKYKLQQQQKRNKEKFDFIYKTIGAAVKGSGYETYFHS